MLKELLGNDYDDLLNCNDLLEKSKKIAEKVFEEKVDKGGNPYMVHLLSVSYFMNDENDKVVAILHDILEDSEVTKEELSEFGYPDEIIESIEILTRKDKEDYSKYIDRVIASENLTALNVKLFDLKNNMDISRIKNPTPKDFSRIETRYRPAYIKIENKINEMRDK